MYNIYLLCCPFEYKVKYIGLTKNIKDTKKRHFGNKQGTKEKRKWISRLKKYDLLKNHNDFHIGLPYQNLSLKDAQKAEFLVGLFYFLCKNGLTNDLSALGNMPPKSKKGQGKGRQSSQTCKENISKSLKGKQKSKKHKENISKGKKNKVLKSTLPVSMFDLDGNWMKDFSSSVQAERRLAKEGIVVHRGHIINVCKGKKYYKTAGGYAWKFKRKI